MGVFYGTVIFMYMKPKSKEARISDEVFTDRRLSRGCVCIYQSAEWALVKGLTGTDLVVVQALNDHQRLRMPNLLPYDLCHERSASRWLPAVIEF